MTTTKTQYDKCTADWPTYYGVKLVDAGEDGDVVTWSADPLSEAVPELQLHIAERRSRVEHQRGAGVPETVRGDAWNTRLGAESLEELVHPVVADALPVVHQQGTRGGLLADGQVATHRVSSRTGDANACRPVTLATDANATWLDRVEHDPGGRTVDLHAQSRRPVPYERLPALAAKYPDSPCWTTAHIGRPCGPDCLAFTSTRR